ncbi:nucleoside recognition domain-containing protein [Xiashengella succiniciproducens]|uniref:Spore maturation protein n=1 Tax=Xiashengella succiniciproducens TaxID=2949635 RepID=A0A9J6ZQM9_9BACT|nr:spore maturation protein [Alkaliflexus sp. Ai-910]URW79937.1 spore maturation protein [Alkaliflexus sp. Ai-910]
MVLNYIWIAFFVVAFIVALVRLIVFQDYEVFPELVNSTFDYARIGFETSLGLTGVLTLWLGFMKIAEKGGMVSLMSKAIGPLFSRLFPSLPKNHPAYGSMMMNFAANMLGLDNAATPMGLKAMDEMQNVNPQKDRASDAQIMFLVLNTSGLTIIPISIMVYRAQLGAANPADIFLPIMLATFFSTMAGLISVAIVQRIKLHDPVVLAYLGGASALVGALLWGLSRLDGDQLRTVSLLTANLMLFAFIIVFIVRALIKKINVYEAFIEGGKEGFGVAIKIIPYLIAILVGIGVFRASGAMDFLIDGIAWVIAQLGIDTRFVDALPTALMKPLSGSGARGMMIDTMNAFGADSFAGRLACIMQGSTETTFYVLALYFGSVGIKNTRYALPCGLLADLAGIIAAILIGYMFFG